MQPAHQPGRLGDRTFCMPTITRRAFVASLSCTPYALSKSWNDQPFPSWTPEFVDRLLTDSPWAKPGTVSYEYESVQRMQPSNFAQISLPGGISLPGSGRSRSGSPSVRTEIYITTRWSSALPIRRALALQEFGAAGLDSDKARELLQTREQEYVVDVAGFPTTAIRQGPKRFEAELLNSARILAPGRRPISAISASVPEHGMHLIATLRFPRFEDLDRKEGTIEFLAQAGRMSIRERFKLKDMVYAGNLEL
jgi:hypothetical protein